MISSLKGLVTYVGDDALVLENAGIGYEVSVPTPVISAVKTGQTLSLHTLEYIRETSRELYGFADRDGLKLFRKLISVSGVGPKTALLLLSIGTTDVVRKAIADGDLSRLTSVPGVGKKTAQKIVLELKGSLEHLDDKLRTTDDVIEALVSLGYSRAEARDTMQTIPATVVSTEDRMRAALQALRKK